MRFTSPSRRALGLLAVSTIGMSTAVLGIAGVASAAPVTSASELEYSTLDGDAGATIDPGYCYALVSVTGGSGGGQDSSGGVGDEPETIEFSLVVEPGQTYTFAPGGDGQPQNGPVVNGPGGVNALYPSVNGGAGVAAGGGGAGSALLAGGAAVATARGGDGRGDDPGTVGGTGGGTSAVSPSAVLLAGDVPDVTTETNWNNPGGAVSMTVIGCDAPYAPELGSVEPGDGQATVSFSEDPSETTADASGYEYSLNGTTWVALTPAEAAAGTFTVTGLTNGTTYPVTMRATSSDNGNSAVADFGTVTPYDTIGAVTGLAVTRGVSSVTVTWNAPTDAGTYPLAGYDVGYGGTDFGNRACALDASVRTCFISFPAGAEYLVTVYAVDSQGNLGDGATAQTGFISGPAVPTSVPTKDDGDIVGPAGPITSVTAGQQVTLVGSGFAPNSTVQLTVFSAPVSLGTVVTDQNGAFSVVVTIPANLANGTHTLVATGIAPDGTTRNLVITVTVSGGVATLANTGFDTAVPLTGGALALLAGAGMLVGARRRTV